MLEGLVINSIDIGFKSYHYNIKTYGYKFNETNVGIILNLSNNFSIGYINKNSINKKSYIIKYNKVINKYVTLTTGLNYGSYNSKVNYRYNSYTQFSDKNYIVSTGIELKYNNFKLSVMPNFNGGALTYLGYNIPLSY